MTLFFVGGGDTVRPQDRFADAANAGTTNAPLTTNATLGTPVRDGKGTRRNDCFWLLCSSLCPLVAFVVNDFLSERDATRSRRPTRWNVLEEKMAVNQHRV